MIFGGLTKLTLLDYPHKVACTVFTIGCNFRCPFCHNSGLVLNNGVQTTAMTEDAVLDFLTKRSNILEGVCVSGGEPLLHSDITDFLRKVKRLGYNIKLDTNGSFPQRLQAIVEEKLVDYVAMDVKNSPLLYAATAGADINLADISHSIEFLKKNTVDYEFRTTVTGNLHTKTSIEDLGKWLKGAKRLYLQKFEHSGELIDNTFFGCDNNTMHTYKAQLQRYIPQTHLRGMEE